MGRRTLPLLIAIAMLEIVGCGPRLPEKQRRIVTVLAAASTVDAMADLVDIFHADHPAIIVRVSTGPSNALAQQIDAGAPADVFLSASKRWAARVSTSQPGALSAQLLTNRLVLIAPRDNPAGVSDPESLLSDDVIRIAIADDGVPAGEHAIQALESLRLYRQLREENKLVQGGDVQIALAYVERGEAEAGIVYATDAKDADRVAVVAELDPSWHGPIVYEAVLLDDDGKAGRQFFEFLLTEEARRVFADHGFGTIDPF